MKSVRCGSRHIGILQSYVSQMQLGSVRDNITNDAAGGWMHDYDEREMAGICRCPG